MGLNRYDARRDRNELEIVHGLEAIGAYVVRLNAPCDLLVGYRGRWIPLEVKDGEKAPSDRRPTVRQLEFAATCQDLRLPFAYVTSLEQALLEIGAVRTDPAPA
jgi:hypothetical protein